MLTSPVQVAALAALMATSRGVGLAGRVGSSQSGGLGVCSAETPCLPWPDDNSDEAAPFQSLGNHRYRLTLPPTLNQSADGPALAIRATLPWRRQDNASRPLAVRALPSHATLPFLVLNATDKECDLLIKPTPERLGRGLPRPWLQNMAFKFLGPDMQYLGSVARVNGTGSALAASGGSWPGAGPHKAMDGLTVWQGAASMALCERICEGWNVGCAAPPCGEEFLVISLGSSAMIDGLALWSVGDGVHDAKHMSLQAGPNVSGPWETIASFQGERSNSEAQIFSFP